VVPTNLQDVQDDQFPVASHHSWMQSYVPGVSPNLLTRENYIPGCSQMALLTKADLHTKSVGLHTKSGALAVARTTPGRKPCDRHQAGAGSRSRITKTAQATHGGSVIEVRVFAPATLDEMLSLLGVGSIFVAHDRSIDPRKSRDGATP